MNIAHDSFITFKINYILMKTYQQVILVILFILPFKSFSQNAFEWNGISPQFENGTSNLVAYIDFGEIALWGNVEVSLTYSFNNQNSTGLYRKTYNIGRNLGASIFSNTSEVTSALGPVADQWKLGSFEVNSVGHLVIPIYHLVSTGNAIVVNIRGMSTITVNTSLINITTPSVLLNANTRDYNYINGKLSVGTSKADPDALFTVAGNINSRELKVKVNAGADFVFHPAYQLPELQSIEKYVKLNKHLPEIPSAKEMKESGLLVGDFQIKLLQKIEELTLYIIDLKKENQEYSKSIKEVKELTIKLQRDMAEIKSNKL